MVEVLYEDDALLFINKPAGMVIQRGFDPDEVVILDQVQARWPTIFLLQRLDRGTSGVLFFSKLSGANRNLTRQFEKKRIRKRYLAICEGELAEKQTIYAPLVRIGAIKFGVGYGGRRAVTHVSPLAASPRGSLLAIDLETGRTHQIRVHLAAIGHALAGDWLYGQRAAVRPMLHAAEVAMTHPLTNTPLVVRAPLPHDFYSELHTRGLDHASGSEDDPTSNECT